MMFSSLRREAISRNQGTFKEHTHLTSYEKCSGSETFTWYGLPLGAVKPSFFQAAPCPAPDRNGYSR